ncbi:MAG TPA: hypothetical protein VLM76_00020 [Patescibacteria group bacterium]|nr:hypothetical protein [Patescibacteria group bacterium]
MHQQIRTSPGATEENIRRVLDILAAAGVNVEGIGPDYESPHVRTAVPHEHLDAALKALRDAGLEPEMRAAIPFALPNAPGQLAAALERLARRGYAGESVLVLASRDGDRTIVSIGVRRATPFRAEAAVAELGGWEEPDGWTGGDLARRG